MRKRERNQKLVFSLWRVQSSPFLNVRTAVDFPCYKYCLSENWEKPSVRLCQINLSVRPTVLHCPYLICTSVVFIAVVQQFFLYIYIMTYIIFLQRGMVEWVREKFSGNFEIGLTLEDRWSRRRATFAHIIFRLLLRSSSWWCTVNWSFILYCPILDWFDLHHIGIRLFYINVM